MLLRYDYRCPQCGIIEEKMHRITEDPEYLCDTCSVSMIRQVSCTNYVLKGGGWPDKMRRRGDVKYDPPIAR